jgi:hypothetical protein
MENRIKQNKNKIIKLAKMRSTSKFIKVRIAKTIIMHKSPSSSYIRLTYMQVYAHSASQEQR